MRLTRFSVIIIMLAVFVCLPAEARTIRTYAGQLNINTASTADLTRLPGIGEVIAFRITKERERRGAFRDIAELRSVKGISLRLYEGIRNYVAVTGENSLKVHMDLNTVTKPLLLGVPGMTETEARTILNYRKAHGRFGNIEELKLVPGVGEKRFTELAEWVTVAR
jgi:competence protein ComEA